MNKVLLVILDGFGLSNSEVGNAVKIANTPNFDRISKEYPKSELVASGSQVGLPDGQMGNSEVGHLNMGAGRIVYQDLTRISKSIADGDFFENQCLIDNIVTARDTGKNLHFIGLLSDGGVHSHEEHLYALLDMCKSLDMKRVYVHAILDGRDVAPTSGKDSVKRLEEKFEDIGFGRIATVIGRYYAMDRDKRWDRTNLAYDAIVLGSGKEATDPYQAVLDSYEAGITDEFVEPTVILHKDGHGHEIFDGDSVTFFNFRPDRARQLSHALTDVHFEGFARVKYPQVNMISLTEYEANLSNIKVAFMAETYENTLGEYVSKKGYKQLRIAETEKYAHVTFFFNGGVEKPNENEDRILIPSPKVATYDEKPEMSAYEVRDEACKQIAEEKYQLIVLNFANCDMVGHTGVLDAAVKAVSTVDDCLGQVLKTANQYGYTVFVTADHGNAEQMTDPETGGPFTAHTSNPVPFIGLGLPKGASLADGKLADIAPTILDVLGEDKPVEMKGNSLIRRN